MKEELLRKLIDGAYSCACRHGFHDVDLSIRHLLMLVLTEVSEAVEADRKNLHADIESYYEEVMYGADIYDKDLRSPFEKFVKSTLEDELADVCIRIFDICGTFGIEPFIKEGEEMEEAFRDLYSSDSFCERMYELSCLLTNDIDFDNLDGDDDDSVVCCLGCALSFIYYLCKDMEIDLERHIELKMRYNELRPAKHGKRY